MTLQEATGRYWRASRVLRGHSYGTPAVCELTLSQIWQHTNNPRLADLASRNNASRFQPDTMATVIAFKR